MLLSCLYSSAYHNIRLGIALYSTIYAYGSVYPSCCDVCAYVICLRMCYWLAYAIYASFFQMYANIRTYAYVICAYIYARHIPSSMPRRLRAATCSCAATYLCGQTVHQRL